MYGTAAWTAFWLLSSHAVADYPLQSDFMAKGKNHRSPLPGVDWWVILLAHSFLHGAGVALATGSLALALGEVVAHFAIDFGKSSGWYGFKSDQLLHVLAKGLWLTLWMSGIS